MTSATDFLNLSRVSTRRSMILTAAGALIGLVIAGYGLFTARGTRLGGIPPEAVVLINQRPILRSDFMTQTEAQYFVPFARTSREQRKKVIDEMIDEELLVQRGLEIDLPSYDPDVRNALVAGVELEVTADVIARQPTVEVMRAYYEAHKNQYASDGVMQLRDLVVKLDASISRETAHAAAYSAAAELRRGRPLEAVMRRYGLVDSGRFTAGGHADLGDLFQFAVRAKVDDALFDALSGLKDGEISEPVEEGDGVHVVVMIRHQLPVAQTFEQASDQVWMDVKKDSEAQVRAANVAYLRGRAAIIIATEYAQ